MVVSSFAIGALATPVFKLGFVDTILTILFFNMLGVTPVCFFSTFGPRFGLRQMVLSRFYFGYYGVKISSYFSNMVIASELISGCSCRLQCHRLCGMVCCQCYRWRPAPTCRQFKCAGMGWHHHHRRRHTHRHGLWLQSCTSLREMELDSVAHHLLDHTWRICTLRGRLSRCECTFIRCLMTDRNFPIFP